LRRLRYALDISDPAMVSIFGLSGHSIDQSALGALLKKEDEVGYVECSSALTGLFLDGLIIHKRGVKESQPGLTEKNEAVLNNNSILKKMRIALELKEEDMISIMKLVNIVISKSELSALFRNTGHKNFKVCGDQFLRNFLKGLTIRNRNIPLHSD
jgi:uncharacterized protein YehS (DUF1456 family)